MSIRLQRILQYTSAFFSTLINTFLIVLIATKSPKQLGAYKYLMMCISIHEIIYSILEVIVSPMFYTYGSTYFMIVSTKNRALSPFTLYILNSVYCGFFAFFLAIFSLHFIYRYLVASGNKRLLDTFNSWKFFLWLGVPILYAITWGLDVHFLLEPTKSTLEYVKEGVFDVFGLKSNEFVFAGAYIYEKVIEGNSYVLHMAPFIGIILMIFYITLSLTISFVFGMKCYFWINTLVSHSTTSRSTQLLQSQLFYALVSQTLIPVILMHVPLGAMVSSAIVNQKIGNIGDIVGITMALFPAIDPLPTIFMIKNYRKGVFGWCRWLRRQVLTLPRSEVVFN